MLTPSSNVLSKKSDFISLKLLLTLLDEVLSTAEELHSSFPIIILVFTKL